MDIGNLLLTYLIFAALGWIIELTYRSQETGHFLNPGFLKGPYLPIYGFGGFITYLLTVYSNELTVLGSAALFLVSIGVMEYITGFLFQRFFRIRLWDYSDRKFNIHGHVCLRFLVYWLILAGVFKYSLFPYFQYLLNDLNISSVGVFFLGMVYGVFLVDIVNSLDIAYKTRKAVLEFNQNYVSPKIATFKHLYRDATMELNQRVKENKKISDFKTRVLSVNHYFRLSRDLNEVIREKLEKKLDDLREQTD